MASSNSGELLGGVTLHCLEKRDLLGGDLVGEHAPAPLWGAVNGHGLATFRGASLSSRGIHDLGARGSEACAARRPELTGPKD